MAVTANPLDREIAAFEARRTELEQAYPGKYVLFVGADLIGSWDTLDAAATAAISKFGRGPYLIRQVGAGPPVLPASVMYRPVRAA